MSDYSKHETQKVTEAAAMLQINKYMSRETAENLERLRAELLAEQKH